MKTWLNTSLIRLSGAFALGALLSVGGTTVQAEQYLCALKPTSRAAVVAEAMLIDVRQGLYALVFDKNIEDVVGRPIRADVEDSTPKRYRFRWTLEGQRIPSNWNTTAIGDARGTVTYFATLEKKSLAFRVRAKAVAIGNASAEGKCALKK